MFRVAGGRRLMLAALLGSALASAPAVHGGMPPEDYERFWRTYYQHSDAARLGAAVEHFAEASARSATADGLAAQARFFAVLSADQPDLIETARRVFLGVPWSGRERLLLLFERVQDPGLASWIEALAQEEEDPERRVLLEGAAIPAPPPMAILQTQPTTSGQVAEQWACFYATGNTQVVANTLNMKVLVDTEANSLTSVHHPLSLLAAEAYARLMREAVRHAPVWRALLAHARERTDAETDALLATLAHIALDGRKNPGALSDMAAVVEPRYGKVPAQFLRGAAAADADDAAWRISASALAGHALPWARRLEARQALTRWRAVQGSSQARRAAAEEWAGLLEALEIHRPGWYGEARDPGTVSGKPLRGLIRLGAEPENLLLWIWHTPPAVWRAQDTHLALWTPGSRQWIPVRSAPVRRRLLRQAGTEPIRLLLRVAEDMRVEMIEATELRVLLLRGRIAEIPKNLPDLPPGWVGKPGVVQCIVEERSRRLLYWRLARVDGQGRERRDARWERVWLGDVTDGDMPFARGGLPQAWPF